MTHFPDYYSDLGISKSATQDQIDQAYQRLALAAHPLLQEDEEVLAARPPSLPSYHALADAYYTLSCPERRRVYDRAFARQEHWDTISTQHPDQIFAQAFDQLLSPCVQNPGYLYRGLGGFSGAALGLIVGNLPGVILGWFIGEKLGEIRDKRGKSVYEVFTELDTDRQKEILKSLWQSMVHRINPFR
ncbi:MAG: hypothetical protein DHS80DRAFT_31548 [Piptocephalis tieghemiana]|nr:MAG: hypothetical protein DHS80DRAFT_31548 [Piptocephalis tieghemiana]